MSMAPPQEREFKYENSEWKCEHPDDCFSSASSLCKKRYCNHHCIKDHKGVHTA